MLSPDTYRGPIGAGEPDAGAALRRVGARRRSPARGARGRAPAAFICEALYGNAGGIVLPDGYLQAAYAHVRAAGGVCIADEVQVGYGRLGAHFWGFEQQGVVPDIVTIAKATGNGHPGRRRHHDDARSPTRCEGQGGFFASVGGGPVSCEIGLAVLDVIEEEGLQENALRVGGALRAGLEELVAPARDRRRGARHGPLPRPRPRARPRHQGAGARGGLRDLRAPARARRDRAADRRRQNVLKLKPPLVIERRDADWLLETLDGVLARGW